MEQVYIIEAIDRKHNRYLYSITATSEEECISKFNEAKDKDISFERIRETMSRREFTKEIIKSVE